MSLINYILYYWKVTKFKKMHALLPLSLYFTDKPCKNYTLFLAKLSVTVISHQFFLKNVPNKFA